MATSKAAKARDARPAHRQVANLRRGPSRSGAGSFRKWMAATLKAAATQNFRPKDWPNASQANNATSSTLAPCIGIARERSPWKDLKAAAWPAQKTAPAAKGCHQA